ncbi:putative uncharacterized protein DDB_G0277255 isoform X2 [Sitodiplosis mosellana]|uniref:putative uncharacterized protein DDB_G0277255 isoform X2 n=1 Tax=Sitodiplosis mosellana TaxID=263140 RepID=UPI002443AAFD|nr:putative uncharacterized protein DDB_G0277255 isoform X2 [Sitodiplosis mosellana]
MADHGMDPLHSSGSSIFGNNENNDFQEDFANNTEEQIEPNSEQSMRLVDAGANVRSQIDSAVHNTESQNVERRFDGSQDEVAASENDVAQNNAVQEVNLSESNVSQRSTEHEANTSLQPTNGVDSNGAATSENDVAQNNAVQEVNLSESNVSQRSTEHEANTPLQQTNGVDSNGAATSENDVAQNNAVQEVNLYESNVSQQSTEQEANTAVQQTEGINVYVPIKGEPVPLFEPINNDDELQELLATPTDDELLIEEEGDMIITRVRGQVIQPMRSTIDGLVKREKYVVSGNLPFNETKTGRV